MIYCVVGKMASGKDSILKRLSNHPSLSPVVTMTSRAIRSNEKDGIDYYFVSDDDFHNHEFVEWTEFNGWYYGTPKNSIDLSKNQVIVVNPQGLQSFINTYGFDNVVAFLVHRNDRDRAISYLQRDESASVEEMLRRFKTDEKDFGIFNTLKHKNIYHINNETGKFADCVFEIESIIGGYLHE